MRTNHMDLPFSSDSLTSHSKCDTFRLNYLHIRRELLWSFIFLEQEIRYMWRKK